MCIFKFCFIFLGLEEFSNEYEIYFIQYHFASVSSLFFFFKLIFLSFSKPLFLELIFVLFIYVRIQLVLLFAYFFFTIYLLCFSYYSFSVLFFIFLFIFHFHLFRLISSFLFFAYFLPFSWFYELILSFYLSTFLSFCKILRVLSFKVTGENFFQVFLFFYFLFFVI